MNSEHYMVNKFSKKEEEAQKKRNEAQKCFSTNIELKNLLQRVKRSLNKEDYEYVIKGLGGLNLNCDLWNVMHRNHLEQSNVAIAHAVLIQTIIESTNSQKHKYIQTTVNSLIQRLNIFDATVYRKYQYELQAMRKKAPKITFVTDIEKTVELSYSAFRTEAKGMINVAVEEKGYKLHELDDNMIAEDITGIEGNHNLSEEAMKIINEELNSAKNKK